MPLLEGDKTGSQSVNLIKKIQFKCLIEMHSRAIFVAAAFSTFSQPPNVLASSGNSNYPF